MSLEMRGACERGGPRARRTGLICGHGCTFCEGCAEGMDRVCPNCGGEPVRRPRREA
jgi:uncharacterized protein